MTRTTFLHALQTCEEAPDRSDSHMRIPRTATPIRDRAVAILNDPAVREFYGLLEIARRQLARDPKVTDTERTARSMVEAYYRGLLDRQRRSYAS